MGKRPEQTFFKKRYMNGQQVHEKMLNIASCQGNANQNNNEISQNENFKTLLKEIEDLNKMETDPVFMDWKT